MMRVLVRRWIKRSMLYRSWEDFQALTGLVKGLRHGTFSQNGEDVYLKEYFGKRVGTYLDIGANHPFLLSNTYLLYRRGWRGITVEPLPRLAAKHRFWRPGDVCLNVGLADVPGRMLLHEFIPHALSTCDGVQAQHLIDGGCVRLRTHGIRIETLADIIRQYPDKLAAVDLLCVDTEGFDLKVLEGNDFSVVRPPVILCELPEKPGPRADLEAYLKIHGYKPLWVFPHNLLFERR